MAAEQPSPNNKKQANPESNQAPFGRRRNGQPNPNPRHMMIAGILFWLGALFIASMIIFNVVPEAERKVSGAFLALIFVYMGWILYRTGKSRR